uniref:(northern house mosquito) hypothetical protein n=1 Tax=Culex pipiens TaxID=7175 RepID=A0A8D8FG33_CULPI
MSDRTQIDCPQCSTSQLRIGRDRRAGTDPGHPRYVRRRHQPSVQLFVNIFVPAVNLRPSKAWKLAQNLLPHLRIIHRHWIRCTEERPRISRRSQINLSQFHQRHHLRFLQQQLRRSHRPGQINSPQRNIQLLNLNISSSIALSRVLNVLHLRNNFLRNRPHNARRGHRRRRHVPDHHPRWSLTSLGRLLADLLPGPFGLFLQLRVVKVQLLHLGGAQFPQLVLIEVLGEELLEGGGCQQVVLPLVQQVGLFSRLGTA